MTEAHRPDAGESAAPKPTFDTPREHVVSTDALFAGRREITIEHEGERYRLRITRRNKLILQK